MVSITIHFLTINNWEFKTNKIKHVKACKLIIYCSLCLFFITNLYAESNPLNFNLGGKEYKLINKKMV